MFLPKIGCKINFGPLLTLIYLPESAAEKNKTITKLSFLTFSLVDFHEEKMALVLHKTVLFNQVCKNALRQSGRFMCMKANPADTPDYNPNEHHHWAKPPSKEKLL